MEKTKYVLQRVSELKAVTKEEKASKRIMKNFYTLNSNRVEELDWEHIKSFPYEQELSDKVNGVITIEKT